MTCTEHRRVSLARQRIDAAVAHLPTRLRTSVQFVGPLSADSALADQAEAVAPGKRSATRFLACAKASTLTVRVKVDDALCIEVTDNGRGLPDEFNGSGLTNPRQRVSSGGEFTLASVPGASGSVLRWSAPLSQVSLPATQRPGTVRAVASVAWSVH